MDRIETEDIVDPKKQAWREFVGLANNLINSGNLERWEIGYKREIARNVAEVRKKVLRSEGDWVTSLRKALRPKHPIHEIPLSDLNQWCSRHSGAAREALHAIWEESDVTVSERIRAFSHRFPKSEVKGGTGTRTTIASALLMGVDMLSYPPFGITMFENAYKRTGYKLTEVDADEATMYEHALGFLDRLIVESRAHGVHLRHRLDAQSVVWQLVNELPTFQGTGPIVVPPDVQSCNLQRLAGETLLTTDFLQEITTLLFDKRQIIFQGPPGTGKTYIAQALAHCLAEESEERVTLVQFHPSYAYEDFVQGFRPIVTESGRAAFKLKYGPLLRAAEKARNDRGSNHFLIIDEINRGNLAKVFGELYFLLEYRDKKIRMQYQPEGEGEFSLPENLYIIGTMNTADRSIAMVDLALRRRFYFVEFHPEVEPVKRVLRKWLKEMNLDNMKWVADVVEEANKLLEKDKHAAIGPSYFMKEHLDIKVVERIWKHSVLPYIEERLFGDDNRLDEFDLDKLKDKAAQTRKQKEVQEQTNGPVESNASAQ